jgi:ATP-dependent Clp protease ATP-binding subunit ClpB
MGVNISRLKDMTESELGRLPKGQSSGGMIMPEPAFNQIVLDAQNRADAMGDEYLSVEHLFLSLASVQSDAKEILRLNSIEPEKIEEALKEIRGGEKITDQSPEGKYRALERYGIDLLEKANSTLLSAETKKSGDACRC